MSHLRLALITRRFWPLIGARERMLAAFARELQEAGHTVTIATAGWAPEWPSEISHGGVSVQRIRLSSEGFIGAWRYGRSLASWLRRHRHEFDLIYVSMLGQDAFVSVGAARKWNLPVVIRAETGAPTRDARLQKKRIIHSMIERRCRKANRIIAPSDLIADTLRDARYSFEQFAVIPNGVTLPPVRTQETRMAARAALGTAHAVLSLAGDTKLVVYTGRLSAENGLPDLIAAWAQVLKSRTNLRLWLVGEGAERDPRLDEQIERLKLRGRCVIVGSFDSVDELLAASDIFVQPSPEDDGNIAILEAMAHSLPVVVADIPSNRSMVHHGETGLLVSRRDIPAWIAAIEHVLDSIPLAAQLGTAARKHVQNQFALSTMVTRHIELFEQLTTA